LAILRVISTALLICVAVCIAFVGGLATFTAWKTYQIETRFPAQGEFVSLPGATLHLTRRAAVGTLRARRAAALLGVEAGRPAR
jgi:hypothetical protein